MQYHPYHILYLHHYCGSHLLLLVINTICWVVQHFSISQLQIFNIMTRFYNDVSVRWKCIFAFQLDVFFFSMFRYIRWNSRIFANPLPPTNHTCAFYSISFYFFLFSFFLLILILKILNTYISYVLSIYMYCWM